jgi:hypothetical protein
VWAYALSGSAGCAEERRSGYRGPSDLTRMATGSPSVSSNSSVLPRYRGPGETLGRGNVWPEMTEAERAVWIAYGPTKEAALARLGLCVAWIPNPPTGSICDRLHKLPW